MDHEPCTKTACKRDRWQRRHWAFGVWSQGVTPNNSIQRMMFVGQNLLESFSSSVSLWALFGWGPPPQKRRATKKSRLLDCFHFFPKKSRPLWMGYLCLVFASDQVELCPGHQPTVRSTVQNCASLSEDEFEELVSGSAMVVKLFWWIFSQKEPKKHKKASFTRKNRTCVELSRECALLRDFFLISFWFFRKLCFWSASLRISFRFSVRLAESHQVGKSFPWWWAACTRTSPRLRGLGQPAVQVGWTNQRSSNLFFQGMGWRCLEVFCWGDWFGHVWAVTEGHGVNYYRVEQIQGVEWCLFWPYVTAIVTATVLYGSLIFFQY